MAKQFQQGGVFNLPNIPAPDVGTINPTINVRLPAVQPNQISGMANLAVDARTRQRQYEQDLANKQKLTDATRDEYLATYDAFFGEVHNPYQQAVLDEVRKDNGISANPYADMDLNDINSMKLDAQKLKKAIRDPRAIKVFGEVEAAKRYLEKPSPTLTEEEQLAWKTTYDQYKSAKGPFDVVALDRNAYKRPAAKTPPAERKVDWDTALRLNANSWLDLDLENPESADVGVFGDILANVFKGKDEEAAIAKGYITVDDFGTPTITDIGFNLGLNKILPIQRTYNKKNEDDLSEYEKKRRIAQKTPMPSSGRAGSTEKTQKEIDQVSSVWDQILGTLPELDAKYGGMDPFTNPALYKYLLELSTTEGVTGDLRTKKRIIDKDLDLIQNPNRTKTPVETSGMLNIPEIPIQQGVTGKKPVVTYQTINGVLTRLVDGKPE